MNDREQVPHSAEAPQPSPKANEAAAQAARPSGDALQLELPQGALILLPTRNAVLFPGIVGPLALGRERSIPAAQAAAKADKAVGILLQNDASVENPGPQHLHRVGTAAEILREWTPPDGIPHL